MRILVYPHLMEIGGSQLNAIELAAAVQRRGHEVVVFAPEGRLVGVAEKLGLEIVAAPRSGSWPAPANMAALRRLIAERDIEIAHGYEWGPAVELSFGLARCRTRVLVTSMSMSIPDFLPRHVPLVVGTRALASQQGARRQSVHLMEPPIDTERYAPRPTSPARVRFGFKDTDLVVAVICRLSDDLGKLEGVLAAVAATSRLAHDLPVRLLVVGDGVGLNRVRESAHRANLSAGDEIVCVAGPLDDPTKAYDAADVIIGMGSSALKGMSCGRPLVVQGNAGFWRTLDEASLPRFRAEGWFGHGGAGVDDLAAALRDLFDDPARRVSLGVLGREVVQAEYGLERAALQLENLYSAMTTSPRNEPEYRELLRTGYELTKFKVDMATSDLRRQRWQRR